MKRAVWLLFVIIISLNLISCNGDKLIIQNNDNNNERVEVNNNKVSKSENNMDKKDDEKGK